MSSSAISLRDWLVLISVGTLVFLMNIDYTAVNLTLVPISEEISADLNSLQWLLSGYVLTWAAFVVPAGRIADIYGKRNTLIFGLFLFMIGSCLTGFADILELLIAGRFLQGLGAAIFTAPAWALIFTSAPPQKQGFVMGLIMSFAGLGLAAGPTLAGIIIQEIGWRWIFYINLPFGFLIIAVLYLYAAPDKPEKVKDKFNVLSAVLLSSFLYMLIDIVDKVHTQGMNSFSVWRNLAIMCSVLFLYVWRENKHSTPLVPLKLWKNKAFMATTFATGLIAMCFSATLVLISLYLQNTLECSSYETGLIFISMTITMGILGPIGGRMSDRFHTRNPMLFGCFATAFAMGLMTFFGPDTPLLYVIISLFIVGAGLGVFYAAANTAMFQAVPAENLAIASGVYTMSMMIGNTLSIVLSTSLVVFFGRNHLMENVRGMMLTPEQYQDLNLIIGQVEHSALQLKDFPADAIPQLLEWIDNAFVYGLSLNMMLGTACALAAASFIWWGASKTVSKNSGAAPTMMA